VNQQVLRSYYRRCRRHDYARGARWAVAVARALCERFPAGDCPDTFLEYRCDVTRVIDLTFPGGRALSFFGHLSKFVPGEMEEGESPGARVTMEVTGPDWGANPSGPILYSPKESQK
jgi:hypothetical protein